MSVALYSPEELGRVMARYAAFHRGQWYAPKPDELVLALTAFHFANHAAFCISYADWDEGDKREAGPGRFSDLSEHLEIRDGTRQALDDDAKRRLVWDLRLLLSNAVSQGGTEFLPDRYQWTIRKAARALTDELAGMAE